MSRAAASCCATTPTDRLTIDAGYTNQTETSDGSSRYTPAGSTAFQTPGHRAIKGCDLCNTDVTLSPWRDNLEVYSLTLNYKFDHRHADRHRPTSTTVTLDFNFDSTPILVSFGIPVPAESRSRRRGT